MGYYPTLLWSSPWTTERVPTPLLPDFLKRGNLPSSSPTLSHRVFFVWLALSTPSLRMLRAFSLRKGLHSGCGCPAFALVPLAQRIICSDEGCSQQISKTSASLLSIPYDPTHGSSFPWRVVSLKRMYSRLRSRSQKPLLCAELAPQGQAI